MLQSQYYLIDIANLQSYLDSLDKKDPERTHSHLDLLLENIRNNLWNILAESDNKIMVEVDHDNLKVSLLWEKLPISNRKPLREANNDTQETIYEFFLNTQEQEIRLGKEWELIKEINPKQ